MKTRPLILIGTVLALSSLSLPFIISETSPKPEIPKMPNLELIDELVDLGCTEPAINHVSRYSNLLDDSFDGTYYLEWIGLPDDLSQVELDKCVKIILEKRIIELYKDTPEVIAFYAKYDDTQVSVRDDHVSYFAGNEDDFRVRMNLEFDENYEIENIEFHCYVQREHQTEVPQTFILKFLKDWTCNEYGTQRNEN